VKSVRPNSRPSSPATARVGVRAALLWALLASGCLSHHHFQNLVVWNQTEAPERISIVVDRVTLYSGLLGTADSFPKIVVSLSLGFPVGPHTLIVRVPGRHFERSINFEVGRKPVNLHVMVNVDDVQIGVTYGTEAYL
jgi:hypothetical protein